jgi:hypothetical protein
MQNRTRVIIAAVVAAALAAGSTGAALASTAGTKPGARPATVSASGKPTGEAAAGALGGAKAAARASAAAQPGNDDAFTAAVARELHTSAARVDAALRPLLATGRVDSSSAEFAAAARALGVSPQQLFTALAQAKQSLAGSDSGPKAGSKPGAGTGGK